MKAHTLKDKVVLITGGSAGIGLAAGQLFASLGARVVLIARGKERLEHAVKEIQRAGGTAMASVADASIPQDCDRVLREVEEAYGRLDVLVNNAGLHHRGSFLDNNPVDLAKMIQVNLESPIYLTRTALPLLLKNGGAIVNVASLAGCIPVPDSATYSASKFGLRAFSLALRSELDSKGVSVSLVSPGPVNTEFILGELDEVTDITLSQPMITAERVAKAVVAAALDGKAERKIPATSGLLTTLGYLFPALKHALRPLLEKKGGRAKAILLAQRNSDLKQGPRKG
jgi:short-subunit dehydrogenase